MNETNEREFRPLPRIGLALSGGGARALGHVHFLSIFDEYNIKPAIISGTSMGALIGAMYASGMSAAEIEKTYDSLHVTWWRVMTGFSHKPLHGLFKDDFLIRLIKQHAKHRFEDLEIPLKVVCADLGTKEEVVFERGDLVQAVRASIAFSGLFAPVTIDGHTYIDGGVINPVPYDLLMDTCDYVIAIDLSEGEPTSRHQVLPVFSTMYSATQIMMNSIVTTKLRYRKPELFIKKNFPGITSADFNKTGLIKAELQEHTKILREALTNLVTTFPQIQASGLDSRTSAET
jgi:NTE family protein